ncbi:hypothetical protein BKA70DRAFT_1300803 [Coprinopsis sp. MPI-PUGE-AT-0042]|nr:hypothetical protein BKA70DRAFT_1300803 [Coprinopsis sp. MPI-PUGE-AT-0042]
MPTDYPDPLQRLPPEISITLFQIVIMDDFYLPSRPFDPPAVLSLCQVCQSWREFVCSAPTLWNALRMHNPSASSVRQDKAVTHLFDNPYTGSSQRSRARVDPTAMISSFVERLCKWMQKSNSIPFHLSVTLPDTSRLDIFFSTLLQPHHANRCQSLNLTIAATARRIAESFPLLASNLQCQFPILSHFSLRMVGRDTTRVEPYRVLKGVVSVWEPSSEVPASHPRGWQGLTQRLTNFHLNVIMSPSYAAKVLCDAFPTLVECTIEVGEYQLTQWGPSLDHVSKDNHMSFPRLKSLNLTLYFTSSLDFLNSWELPVLEDLAIRGREEAWGRRDSVMGLNEQALSEATLEKLAATIPTLKSLTLNTVPSLNKDNVFTLIWSCHSLSQLSLINLPGLGHTYQEFFAGFVHGPESALQTLSIDVVVGGFDTDEVFSTRDFVQLIVNYGCQMRVFLRLLATWKGWGDILKSEIEAELAECGIDRRFWPRVNVGKCNSIRRGEIILGDIDTFF